MEFEREVCVIFPRKPLFACHESAGGKFVPEPHPTERSCFAGVQVRDAPGNLLLPGALNVFVHGCVEAFKKRASQCGSLVIGQGKRFLQQLESSSADDVSIALQRARAGARDANREIRAPGAGLLQGGGGHGWGWGAGAHLLRSDGAGPDHLEGSFTAHEHLGAFADANG